MKFRSLLASGLALFALILVAGGVSRGQSGIVKDGTISDDEAARIRIGFLINPVPLNLRHKDRNLVGLGSYLANAVSACSDCHTAPQFLPGHNPHLGQPPVINTAQFLAGGTSFGPVVSRNITPDEHGLPAGLTLAGFLDVMHTGLDPDQLHPQLSHFLLVMPFPAFNHMTRHELEAIYAYLTAIPHADNPNAPPQ